MVLFAPESAEHKQVFLYKTNKWKLPKIIAFSYSYLLTTHVLHTEVCNLEELTSLTCRGNNPYGMAVLKWIYGKACQLKGKKL